MNYFDIEKLKNRVLTMGWGIVFFIVMIMNVYLLNSYLGIPFSGNRISKLMLYHILHVFLFLGTVYYFTLFFSGKTETKRSVFFSKVAGYYITFLSYSVILFLVFDLIYLLGRLTGEISSLKAWLDYLSLGGLIVFIPAAILAAFSLLNAKHLKVKEYEIEIDKKDSSLEDLNIVYVSDAHIGTAVSRHNIDRVVKEIENLKPDLLLLGGDFFDEGTMDETKKLVASKVSKIETKYGTYGIEGNHEYKNSNHQIDEEMVYFERENIKILQDEVLELKDNLYIIGRKDREGNYKSLEELVKLTNKNLPTILLDHRPSFYESRNFENIDLQISGHTHNGQFFPVGIFDYFIGKVKKEYFYGYHKINKMHHIVSSGLGTWGVPVRLGSKREIVNIKIQFK